MAVPGGEQVGPHHLHVVGRGHARRIRAGQLLVDQGGAHRAREDRSAGRRPAQHHLQRDRAGDHRVRSRQSGRGDQPSVRALQGAHGVQALRAAGGHREHDRVPVLGRGGLHHRRCGRGRGRHSALYSLMSELVEIRREGPIARVVMHRNGNNAIAEDLMEDLAAAFTILGDDPEARVIVLASDDEKYFSVGADLTALGAIDRQAPDATDQIAAFMKRMNAHFATIESCPKPVNAAINGHALGGGSELALCCDVRIMVEDGRSRIGQTESSLGIIPGAGGTQRLPRLIGKARALRYMIESTRLSAREAEAVGWVDQAVAPEDFQAAVDQRAAKLAKAATLAIAMIKDAVRRGYDLPLDQALDIEAANFARAAMSTDAAIGIMSFLSKQEPEFTGS